MPPTAMQQLRLWAGPRPGFASVVALLQITHQSLPLMPTPHQRAFDAPRMRLVPVQWVVSLGRIAQRAALL